MRERTRINVDAGEAVRPFNRFWRGTGFSPAELLLEPEMRQMLAYIGGLPNEGIKFLRVHYLYNLLSGKGEAGYDWSLLDRALDVMIEHRLKPFFELMGNPSGVFTDYEDMDQVKRWRDLVTATVDRYGARYGMDELRTWYFETTNEADSGWWTYGIKGYTNYYDACVAGLDAIDPSLPMGGPGTARTLSPIFRALMAHCDSGTSCLTGDGPPRLDYISIHEKGVNGSKEDLTPKTNGIVDRTLLVVDYLKEHHPRLAGLPIVNDECDPQLGWSDHHSWHGKAYYAGIIARIIEQHDRRIIAPKAANFTFLSNDHAFIGGWSQRTIFAYFGSRNFTKAQWEHKTNLDMLVTDVDRAPPFDIIKKPGLTSMELLATLGDTVCKVTAEPPLAPDQDGLAILPTRLPGGGVSISLIHSVDAINRSGRTAVRLEVSGLVPGRHALCLLRIDEEFTNPMEVWEAQRDESNPRGPFEPVGAPPAPTEAQFAELRRAQEPALLHPISIVDCDEGRISVDLDVPLPSLTQVLVVPDTGVPPAAPSRLVVERYLGLGGREERMLFWAAGDASPAIFYDVLVSTDGGTFEKVSSAPLISTAFLHMSPPEGVRYAVCARDAFGRRSELCLSRS
ncbi:glycosyl hydrolase [Rhizobium leguminosarum]|uniref:GH39 family glycosyl hydrolase n=1 Tax=Rhizobium ruizarguesonis TaxID=2081791 RepID=UPI0013E06B06|nr:glycosyl hydrolase [Rhizobium ruizarguesonis]NEJ89472.1 glycosyl hydrolase [Rhizobium ruizarguesonis]